MKINVENKIHGSEVTMEGAKNVEMKILIGEKDGSKNIIMRKFKVFPGGNTPLHKHDFEHVVKVENGKGFLIDEKNGEHQLEKGQSAYISPNELHQFKNPFEEPFEFLCIILNKK